jgi:hypothetical protein
MPSILSKSIKAPNKGSGLLVLLFGKLTVNCQNRRQVLTVAGGRCFLRLPAVPINRAVARGGG